MAAAQFNCKMCTISFHPRFASLFGRLIRGILQYGWIPAMLFIYMSPPQNAVIVERSEPLATESSKLKFQSAEALHVAASNIETTVASEIASPVEPKSNDASNYAASADFAAEKAKLDQNYGRALGQLPPLDSPPISTNFVFHNKMPKSGSTTMKHILSVLSKENNFILDHQRLCISDDCSAGADDGANGIKMVKEHLIEKRAANPNSKYLFLKHHHWLNMTELGLEKATFINVVRDPITRFASRYYFNRFGWGLSSGARRQTWKNDQEKDQTLDECVANGSEECIESLQVMVQYFCGTDAACGTKEGDGMEHDAGEVKRTDWQKTSRATEKAKQNILKDYYMIGVLEHFNETLDLFDKMLPEFFRGARAASQSEQVLSKRESSKTAHNAGFSNQTRLALEKGLLRYEMDLYNLCKAIFYRRLKFHGIEL
ncbi:Oidioi.mRNA.OKI2018_I69.XSR.g16304.t1.cds [Oikopleura dioica]|uniref:Oidioi.mRNA.OKI2018_I69.XSR.g16304.t1.cds n=1 Tax=Oikopleura dioica TaxID=34765 RepID=A0ABN7SJM0_OIKDI|nr:Oidioi.mRNA.OKI2018_I69.XSR.g16304.t1.cds [Oikopleura dioica]